MLHPKTNGPARSRPGRARVRRRQRPLVGRYLALLSAATVLALSVVVLTAGPAAAHANLLETTPSPDAILEAGPSSVQLRFTEPVEASAGGVSVFGPDGERVDRGAIDRAEDGVLLDVPVDAGTEGTYTVAWRVTSEDGHTISGSFVFHVGRVTGAVEIDDSTPLAVVVAGYLGRWLAYAGTLVALGSVLIRLLVGAGDVGTRRIRQLALLASAAAVGGAVLALVAAAAEAGGRDLAGGLSLAGDFVSEQRTGRLLAARVLAVVAVCVGLAVSWVWRRGVLLLLVPIGGAVLATSLAGHAWTTSSRRTAVASDVIHQTAVGVWVGGAVALTVALGVVADRGRLARRFSSVALAAAAVVAVSGSVSGWSQLRSIEALLWTGYGQLLLLKLAGFGVLVYIGWWNRTQLVALVERSAEPLRRSLRIESAVAAAVLAVTTALVVQPPGRLTVDRPFNTTVTEADLTLQMTAEPAKAGANDLHLYFFEADGVTSATVDAVEIQATTGSLPPRRLTVTPITPSHVSAYGASLSSPGTWTLEISAAQAGSVTTLTIEVPIR